MAERTPLTHIASDTPIKEFPGYYNQDIDELIRKIDELETAISAKDAEIRSLESDFNSALKKIRAEYLALFAQLNNGNSD